MLPVDRPGRSKTPETELLGIRLRHLASQGVSVLLVEHDLALVRDICDRLVVLDFGRVIASGATSEVLNDPLVESAYLGAPPVGAAS